MTLKRICNLYILIGLLLLTPLLSPISAAAINVTATVQPNENAVTVEATSSQPNETILHEGDMVEITISYKSLIDSTIPFKLNSSWQKGLVQDSDFNYIDVFEYVQGSATISSEGVHPIIDLANNSISWSMSSIHQTSSPLTVSYKLKVKDELLTTKKMDTIIDIGGSIGEKNFDNQIFKYSIQANKIASPTPTSIPTNAPTISPSSAINQNVTPTITETSASTDNKTLSLQSVQLSNISNQSATIQFISSKNSTFTLIYGTNSNNLNQTITSLDSQITHISDIPSLLANTQYYFVIKLSTSNEKFSSDIFTFKTASKESNITISNQDISLIANDIPITTNGINSIILPVKQVFTITIKLDNSDSISDVRGKFINAKVLGINVFADEAPEQETKFIELFPGVFSAQLQAPNIQSQYNISLQIKDRYGGYINKILPFKINVSPPIKVINSRTNDPIENANIYIQKYDTLKKTFTAIANSIVYNHTTDQYGQIYIALPPGEYKFTVKTFGFNTLIQTEDLAISADHYPVFKISPSMNIIDIASSYSDSLIEVLKYTNKTSFNFFTSPLALRLIIGLDFLIDIGLYFIILIVQKRFKKLQSFTRFQWIKRNLFLSFINSIVLYSFIMTILFVIKLKLQLILPLIVETIAMIVFWLVFINLEWKIVSRYYVKKNNDE